MEKDLGEIHREEMIRGPRGHQRGNRGTGSTRPTQAAACFLTLIEGLGRYQYAKGEVETYFQVVLRCRRSSDAKKSLKAKKSCNSEMEQGKELRGIPS
jgi:hypothetical protein